jgi:hypothetical protein
MATRKHQPKEPKESAVDLAVAAVEGNANPLDEDMSAVSPDRTSLDLPDEGHQETCSRCARPAMDRCPECGSPLCENCAAVNEG